METLRVPEIERILLKWAASKPFIRRLWVFGSRVRGEHRPESDLDVAIEIHSVGRDSTPYTSFFFRHEEWRSDLQLRLPLKLHLCHYNPDCDSELHESEGNVVKAVNRSSVLLYDAEATPNGPVRSPIHH